LGTNTNAQVTILDNMPQLTLDVYQPVAVQADQSPGLFLINRSGILDRSVFVRLQISGTAVNGVDYNRINSFFSLASGQTTGLIEIDPKAGAVFQAGKSVELTIKPDSTYSLGSPSVGRIILIDQMMSLPAWRSRYFPASTTSIEAFAAEDPGSYGIPNFSRYAHGLNPTAPDRSHLPRAILRDGYLTMDVWQRLDAADLNYVVEVSTDLFSWTASTNSLLGVPPSGTNDPNVFSFRGLPATTNSQKLFMKLRVNYTP